MKNNILKVTSSALVVTLVFGALAPTTKVFAEQGTVHTASMEETTDYGNIIDEDIIEIEDVTEEDMQQLEQELQEQGITSDDIANALTDEMPEGTFTSTANAEPVFSIMGIRGKSASVAAKQMIKQIKKVGQEEYDKRVKKAINKLPVSKKVKTVLFSYLSYKVVMGTLNIVVDFNGNATEGLKKGFKKYAGMNDYFTGLCARIITTLLL